MYFNSFEYILFFWTVYVLYWTLRNRRPLRLSMVLVASYWFYAQADWRFTGLLFTSTVVDWICGQRMHAANQAGDDRARRLYLGISLVSNLGMLGFFKYFDFFVDSFEALFASLGRDLDLWHLSAAQGGPLDYIVPAGISFYTFQTLSYTIDIYQRKMEPAKSHLDFAVYVAFFPQLVAGPIVRARDFLPQLERQPGLSSERIGSGLFQILCGMAKKLVIADVLGTHLVDHVYRDADSLTASGGAGVLIATYAFTMQLLGDFAGYSDIAIGSARILGFDLKKNFNMPFKSRSLEEFWKRWHISLSSWFLQYVFNGLGGARGGNVRFSACLFATFFLSGLWHGAGWNFVLWGSWFGMWMVIVRVVRMKLLPRGRMPRTPLFSFLGWAFTYHLCVFSLLLFRSPDGAALVAAVTALGDWSGGLPPIVTSQPWQVWAVLGIAYLTALMPDSWVRFNERTFVALPGFAQGLVLAAALVFFLGIAPPGLSPFIYFQF